MKWLFAFSDKEAPVRISIFKKLFICLFLTSILLVVGMTFFVNYSFKSGFQEYLNHQEKKQVEQIIGEITKYYSTSHGWAELKQHPELWAKAFTDLDLPFPVPSLRPAPNSFARPAPSDSDFLSDYNSQDPSFDEFGEPNDSAFFNGEGRPPEAGKFMPNNPMLPYESGDELVDLGPTSHRLFLEDSNHKWVAGVAPTHAKQSDAEYLTLPVKVNNVIVGWFVLKQKNLLDGPLVSQFYAQQQSNIFWIIGLAGLASLIVALGLVRHFLSPLKKLQQGASALSAGDYCFQFDQHSNDEFGELSLRFQNLAGSLQSQKQSREQWLVDISHELRTPIAVLRSELEAIQDGIRKPEMNRIDSMHSQVMGLRRLVDDLYLLSKTDSGVYQLDIVSLDLTALIRSVAERFDYRMTQKGLSLEVNTPPRFIIKGDSKTLEQLCVNLLENSLRYTDAPGRVVISLLEKEKEAVLLFSDSSPSVSAEHLPKLFGRLYRVDQSRSRSHGGSGLGLSICHNIVMMHGGTVAAKTSELGGITIEVRLKRE